MIKSEYWNLCLGLWTTFKHQSLRNCQHRVSVSIWVCVCMCECLLRFSCLLVPVWLHTSHFLSLFLFVLLPCFPLIRIPGIYDYCITIRKYPYLHEPDEVGDTVESILRYLWCWWGVCSSGACIGLGGFSVAVPDLVVAKKRDNRPDRSFASALLMAAVAPKREICTDFCLSSLASQVWGQLALPKAVGQPRCRLGPSVVGLCVE